MQFSRLSLNAFRETTSLFKFTYHKIRLDKPKCKRIYGLKFVFEKSTRKTSMQQIYQNLSIHANKEKNHAY